MTTMTAMTAMNAMTNDGFHSKPIFSLISLSFLTFIMLYMECITLFRTLQFINALKRDSSLRQYALWFGNDLTLAIKCKHRKLEEATETMKTSVNSWLLYFNINLNF